MLPPELKSERFLEADASEKTDDGRARLVRHGHLPEREIIRAGSVGAVATRRLDRRTPRRTEMVP